MASQPWLGESTSQPPMTLHQSIEQHPAQPEQEQHQMPPSSDSQSQDAASRDHLDRQMVRHLLSRYSEAQLASLMQEERTSPLIHSDTASVMTSSTFSSVKSEDAPSLFDAASVRTFSTDNSSARGSLLSNVSARTAKFLRKTSSTSKPTTSIPSIESGESMPWNDTDGAESVSTSGASKQKSSFMCGFCCEEGIQKTCTRKNDLKRHIEDFHNMNAQWSCRHRGCQMVFDWQTAYKTHLKQAHGGSRSSLDDAKVNLCPQTVFACGFEHCETYYEAASDAEAGAKFKEFVSHVVKHFDEVTSSGEWTYSARMRNLLRQTNVNRAWKNTVPEADRCKMQWHPQSSVVLRKRLETRHIGDLQVLIRHAVTLGSTSEPVQLSEDFKLPTRAECSLPILGHPNRANGGSAPVPNADSQFEFKINRALDPSYQAMIASQRRMYVRPPVRSGRSARPPAMGIPRNAPVNPSSPPYGYQQSMQNQAMYPNSALQAHHQQQSQQQHYTIMPQPEGGIIADDLRNFRSMADTSLPHGDVDMSDANMMDANYMAPHASFNGGYGMPNSPDPMNDQQPHTFGAYNGQSY